MGGPREDTAADTPIYTMEEVRKHTAEDDAWIVIDSKVYDITHFWKKHPGGNRVLYAFAGMDASAMYHLNHFRKDITNKYLKLYEKGPLQPESISERNRLIDQDYTDLTTTCEKMGLFKANYLMEVSMMAQVVGMILLSIAIVQWGGNDWLTTVLSAIVLGLAWVMSSYVFHDFGHRAVTHSVTLDYIPQLLFTNLTLGFCTAFVQVYHNLHHTFPHKTGAVLKNEETDNQVKRKLPFWRTILNVCTTAPALFPFIWIPACIKVSIKNRSWVDLFFFALFYWWYASAFYPELGIVKMAVHFIIAREVWSHVVFFIALANHIDVPIGFEGMTFFEYQVACSINFTQNWFVDWITGSQNGQIEHHLWPHMPRENFTKAAPLVKSLFEKWNIPYVQKTVFGAYFDVFDKLRKKPGASRPYDLWFHMMYRTE